MKKIVVFSNMYPSKQHPTFGLFVKNQVDLLQSAGQAVDVIAIDNPDKGKLTALKKYMSWFLRSCIYMLKNRKQLALTHAHYAFPTGVLSLVGKKMLGIPYVVTVHGGDIDKMAAKNVRIRNFTRKILQQGEAVIVVGEKLKNDVILRFGVPESKVHILSMGVNTTIFKPAAKKEVREELNLSIEEKVILFVGNVIKAKGLLELVEAFEMVKSTTPNAALYLVGSQKDTAFVEELQSFIQERKVEGIHFKSAVGQADLARWMSAADIVALPSHHEGFGLVALEAMATGTKVVATDVGGLSYLLSDGAGILVEPKNTVSLAEGLKKALDPTMLSINEVAVQQRVTANSFDSILQALLSIYHKAGKI
ncbi:glycosyltransferase [Filibacter tadaridae]|uniref:Teichuronic acid biosynthesis glycosyltransferase TuaC n=1 Tax=Filibacter tadaridae TaxID=2483811 RepID=A0A3P5WSJ7_9BACL|nr:glycosyltransferase [Filibacter tadaridae]VDC24678.1 Putative teichuronic acid biosynthesis glycosyltransferase TuaC [Filibacter tadaridae]